MSEIVNLPRRRSGRVAPANLRPASLTSPDVAALARLIDRLPGRERDR